MAAMTAMSAPVWASGRRDGAGAAGGAWVSVSWAETSGCVRPPGAVDVVVSGAVVVDVVVSTVVEVVGSEVVVVSGTTVVLVVVLVEVEVVLLVVVEVGGAVVVVLVLVLVLVDVVGAAVVEVVVSGPVVVDVLVSAVVVVVGSEVVVLVLVDVLVSAVVEVVGSVVVVLELVVVVVGFGLPDGSTPTAAPTHERCSVDPSHCEALTWAQESSSPTVTSTAEIGAEGSAIQPSHRVPWFPHARPSVSWLPPHTESSVTGSSAGTGPSESSTPPGPKTLNQAGVPGRDSRSPKNAPKDRTGVGNSK